MIYGSDGLHELNSETIHVRFKPQHALRTGHVGVYVKWPEDNPLSAATGRPLIHPLILGIRQVMNEGKSNSPLLYAAIACLQGDDLTALPKRWANDAKTTKMNRILRAWNGFACGGHFETTAVTAFQRHASVTG